MWVLYLNPMTANAEFHNAVAVAETKQQLLDFIAGETVEPYTEGRWHKVFKKGGPLEMYNPPDEGNPWYETYRYIGTEEEYVERSRDDYRDFISSLKRV